MEMVEHSMTEGAPHKRHAGTRTCVGCGARVERAAVRRELVRLVLVPSSGSEGEGAFDVVADISGSATGRGAWVHVRRSCLEAAAKKGLSRAARGFVKTDADAVAEQIRVAATRRAQSLLLSARRAGRLAIGGTEVSEARAAGKSRLVVVARDAAAAAKLSVVIGALSAGEALAWGTKDELTTAIASSKPVAVIAICDDGLAGAFQHAVSVAETFAAGAN
jgi:predicted RNA-binding protein YlxR (DUF448 family)